MDITDTAGTNPCSSTQNSAQESTLADWTDSVRKTQRAWKDIWGVQERFLRWRDKMSSVPLAGGGAGGPECVLPVAHPVAGAHKGSVGGAGWTAAAAIRVLFLTNPGEHPHFTAPKSSDKHRMVVLRLRGMQ